MPPSHQDSLIHLPIAPLAQGEVFEDVELVREDLPGVQREGDAEGLGDHGPRVTDGAMSGQYDAARRLTFLWEEEDIIMVKSMLEGLALWAH